LLFPAATEIADASDPSDTLNDNSDIVFLNAEEALIIRGSDSSAKTSTVKRTNTPVVLSSRPIERRLLYIIAEPFTSFTKSDDKTKSTALTMAVVKTDTALVSSPIHCEKVTPFKTTAVDINAASSGE
jgi:hypothetical protein